MKALVEGFMSQQPVAYVLFGAGAVIAVIMEMLGVPALIFALGMYLPLELNTPALVGGFLAHFLNRRAETTGGERGAGIRERGVIIASGLMAGGALGGVFGAALRLLPPQEDALARLHLVRRGHDRPLHPGRGALLRRRRPVPVGLGPALPEPVRLRVARLRERRQDALAADRPVTRVTP